MFSGHMTFYGVTDNPVFDVSSGFQSQSGHPYSYLAEICDVHSLKFTSGASPALDGHHVGQSLFPTCVFQQTHRTSAFLCKMYVHSTIINS